MKALVHAGPKDFFIADRPKPSAGPGEVLIRPHFSGICYTDKHAYEGAYPLPYPEGGRIGGHEFCGEVMELGAGVEGLKKGNLVSIDPRIYCGECMPCRAGLYVSCERSGQTWLGANGPDGGHAEFSCVPAYSCFPVPGDTDMLAISCVEPACCGTRAVRNSGVSIGDNIVLFGLEDYNLFALQWLRAAGVKAIVAVDPIAHRRRQALDWGATATIDPDRENPVEKIRAVMPFGADLAFVSFENYIAEGADYLNQAMQSCRVQATVAIMRSYGPMGYQNIADHVPWGQELSIRFFGNFFGEEPWRGGRERGDWQLTIESMANGTLKAPVQPNMVIPFSKIRTKGEVDEIFGSLPFERNKVIFDMTH